MFARAANPALVTASNAFRSFALDWSFLWGFIDELCPRHHCLCVYMCPVRMLWYHPLQWPSKSISSTQPLFSSNSFLTQTVSPHTGLNTLEPDKAAGVGLGYARLYMLKGDPVQLTSALNTANALLRNEVTSPNHTHSPWPFRVRADTGAVVESYTSSVTDALRLFDALAIIARVGGAGLVPQAAQYAACRERVLA